MWGSQGSKEMETFQGKLTSELQDWVTKGVYRSPDQNTLEPPLKTKLSRGQTTVEWGKSTEFGIGQKGLCAQLYQWLDI